MMPKHFLCRLCFATLLAIAIAEETSVFPNEPSPEQDVKKPTKETITRGYVFITIIALSFGCLTQPYGSLLDTKDKTWLRRLSPFAALLERMIILFCLLKTPLAPTHEPTTDGEVSPSQNGGAGHLRWWTRLSRFCMRLQRSYSAKAGALLLTRSTGVRSSADIAPDEMRSQLVGTGGGRFQFFSVPPVILMLVKIYAKSEAQFVVFCTVVYIFGWAMVQALLLLAAIEGMKPFQLEAVAKRQPAVLDSVHHFAWKAFGNVSRFYFIYILPLKTPIRTDSCSYTVLYAAALAVASLRPDYGPLISLFTKIILSVQLFACMLLHTMYFWIVLDDFSYEYIPFLSIVSLTSNGILQACSILCWGLGCRGNVEDFWNPPLMCWRLF